MADESSAVRGAFNHGRQGRARTQGAIEGKKGESATIIVECVSGNGRRGPRQAGDGVNNKPNGGGTGDNWPKVRRGGKIDRGRGLAAERKAGGWP